MTETDTEERMKRHIYCNRCNNETNHFCEREHFRDFENLNPDGSLGFVERMGYRLWICAGCETGTLEEYYIFDITGESGEDRLDSNYYPERTVLHVKGKEFVRLPKKLTTIYQETLHAYNNNLIILCALGIRSLLEGICADKQISGKTLEKQIDNMVKVLPQNIVTNLHSIRFFGNEAAHELAAPELDDLRIAIEICEDILNFLYELDYKAQRLNRRRMMRDRLRKKSVTKVDDPKT